MIKAWRGRLQTAEGKRNNRWTLILKGFGARKNLSIWVKVESAGAEIWSDLDSAARVYAWRGGGSTGVADFWASEWFTNEIVNGGRDSAGDGESLWKPVYLARP